MASEADFAGAMAAIVQRLKDDWDETPIAIEGEDPVGDWPPVNDKGQPTPWVLCELVDVESYIAGFGQPGDQVVRDTGFIKLYYMIQKGTGRDAAREAAGRLGEIFRQKQFYNTEPGVAVRTTTPRVGRDPLISDDGNTVSGACCTIPYEFTRRA